MVGEEGSVRVLTAGEKTPMNTGDKLITLVVPDEHRSPEQQPVELATALD